jgi:hypothetical protein
MNVLEHKRVRLIYFCMEGRDLKEKILQLRNAPRKTAEKRETGKEHEN